MTSRLRLIERGPQRKSRTEAQAAELEEVLAREGFLAKPRPDRTPLQ